MNRRDVSQEELLHVLQHLWHVPQEPAHQSEHLLVFTSHDLRGWHSGWVSGTVRVLEARHPPIVLIGSHNIDDDAVHIADGSLRMHNKLGHQVSTPWVPKVDTASLQIHDGS